MASILRCGRYIRYLSGLTWSSVRANEGSSLKNQACIFKQNHQGFAGVTVPKTDYGLEQQLKRLDDDVRRVGRISQRDIEDVLEAIRQQHSATSSQSLLIIRCCGNLVPEERPEVRTALVQKIWNTLNTLNVPMDISHYNALLRVYLENEHNFSPTDMLAEIEAKSIEPNRVTYQRLIARYCQQGDIEGATRILEFMREKNLPVNENVFNSLILGHSQANDLESAKGILTVMKQSGLEPGGETYSTLLCCFARYGDIESILNTIDECEKREIYLLDRDLLDVIYNLAIFGHANQVDVILEKLRVSTSFNQDAVNTILRLVNKGYEDVGLKVLRRMPRSTRANGQFIDAGSFFIRQLVKANRPIDSILSMCKFLQDEGLNSKALLCATEVSLTNGSSIALTLLTEMKNSGFPVRQHYFWPIFCSVESNEIIDIIHRMRDEFELVANSETIREYVIPRLREKNWSKTINLLRDAGITHGAAASSAAFSALTSDQIEDTADIMESIKAYYSPQLFKQPLFQALSKTNNYDAFVRIVRQIKENIDRDTRINNFEKQMTKYQDPLSEVSQKTELTELTPSHNDNMDFVGQILIDAYSYYRQNRLDVLEQIMGALVKQGLSVSSNRAAQLSELIGSAMTPHMSELLEKLCSGELEPVPVNNVAYKRSVESMTVEELERLIINVESRQENAGHLKKHLLTACFRSKNLTKTLEVIEKLKAENYKLYSGVWAQLIDLYAQQNKLTEAFELYEKIKSTEKDFVIDNIKTFRIVELLLQENSFDDAISFLERNSKPQTFKDNDGAFNYITSIWRILSKLADSGDVQKLQKAFDTIISGNYVLPNNIILGPLIKVHLVRDDLPKAMEVFEYICETYKSTPWKNELACRLIEKEDATNLQKLTDLSTTIHGEVNSLYDLVLSFIECGRIHQARKILETPGLRTRPYRIDNACERYRNDGMTQHLEGLVEATKDFQHIDRQNIYYNLLITYCKMENAEKALGLWTKMQEEDFVPSEAFLLRLAELLKTKNMDIPFVIPTREPNDKFGNEENLKVKQEKKGFEIRSNELGDSQKSRTLYGFRKAVQTADIETAIQLKDNLKNFEEPSIRDLSLFIEQLVRSNRLSEATKCVNELLAQNKYPLNRIFIYYLNKLVASGDVETMQKLSKKLTMEQKKMLSFDNRLCNTNINAGCVDKYLNNLLNSIENVKSSEEAANLGDEFPRGGAIGILQKYPEAVDKIEKIAELYAKHNILGPVNVLWIHYTLLGNEEASKSIWNKYLKESPRVMFQNILQAARKDNDDKLIQGVLDQLRSSKISEGALGNAFSCLIDILINKNKFEEALESLNDALKEVSLESINYTALERLKIGLEEINKPFPFSLPEKNNMKISVASTSSSSGYNDVALKAPETDPLKRDTD